MKYLLFDLDGTLTDPFEGITNSARYALEKLGYEAPPAEQLRWVIGPPLRETILEFGVPRERVEEAVEAFREYLVPKGLYENQVFDGMEELLRDLKEQGFVLAVATSKVIEYAERVLKHFGLLKYFSCIGGAELDGSRSDKHEVIEYVIKMLKITDRGNTLMLGDRKHDIIGAKKAGIKSAGVLWGYGSEEELKTAGADYIARDIAELRELLNVK